jgi:sec-independent protein translocase protein TatA
MFGSIGGFELLALMGIGLLVFGPRRLPEIGRMLARGIAQVRRAAGEMSAAIQQEADLGDVRKGVGDLQATLQQKAAGMWRDLEQEARAVERDVKGATNVEEPRREPGGPVEPA